MMPGKIPEPTPNGFSVKWERRAMPIQGNRGRVKLMPKLEGLNHCPVRAGADNVAVMNPGVVVLPLYKKRCRGCPKGCWLYKN
jgi:hypothetical protein